MAASEAAVVASEPKPGMRGYITAHPLLLLLPLFAAVVLLRFDPNMEYTWDDSVYVLLTHAFSHGLGKILFSGPQPALEILHPIGLPALLTPIALIWENPVAYKLALAGIYLIGTLIVYRFVRVNFGTRMALFVTLSYALNIYIIEYAFKINAEIVYIPCSVLACAALLRYQSAVRAIGWEALIAAIALNVTIYIRSVGLALLVAAVLWLLWQRSWRKAIFLPLLALLISLPLQLGWVLGNPSPWSGGYTNYLGITQLSITQQITQNIAGYTLNVVRLLVDLPFTMLHDSGSTIGGAIFGVILLLLTSILGFIAWGMLREQTTVGRLLLLYVLIYGGILLVWPYPPAPRFALPILPMLLFFLARGLKDVVSRFAPRLVSAAALGLLLIAGVNLGQHLGEGVFGGSNLVANVAQYNQPSHFPPERQTYIEAALWVAAHSNPAAVIVCSDPYDVYLWSGRHTLDIAANPNRDLVLQSGDYLIATSNIDGSANSLESYAAAHPNRLQLIHKVDGLAPALVYRVIKGKGLA